MVNSYKRKWRHVQRASTSLKGLVAVAVIGLDVGIDLVDSRIKRIGHIRTIGDVGEGLLEDLGDNRIAGGDRTDESLAFGQAEEDLKLAAGGIVRGHRGGCRGRRDQADAVRKRRQIFVLNGMLDKGRSPVNSITGLGNTELPGSGTDGRAVAEIRSRQEDDIVNTAVEGGDGSPVAIEGLGYFSCFVVG